MDGEIVYGKPLMWTKETVDKSPLLSQARVPPPRKQVRKTIARPGGHADRNAGPRPSSNGEERPMTATPRCTLTATLHARPEKRAELDQAARKLRPSLARRARLHRIPLPRQRRGPERLLLLRELDRPRRARRASEPSLPEGMVRPARRVSEQKGRAALLHDAERLRQVAAACVPGRPRVGGAMAKVR